MSDPFRTDSNHQLMREARLGLTLLAITLGTFVYVAYYRISGSGVRLPDYVINAPIAESVWPGENPPPQADKNQPPQSFGSQFGEMLASARDKFGIAPEKTATENKHRRTGDYQDPIPRQDNMPLPAASVPDIEPANLLASTRVQRGPSEPLEQNRFAANRSRGTTEKIPLEANDLRPAKSDANSAVVTDFASRKVDRASQQQAITKPVIVTPEKIADSDFSAEPLRPFSEPAGVQLTRAGNLAPETDSAKDFALRNEASKRNEPQPPADDNSFSHEGSQIASQVLTPDLSSNLTDNDPDPVAGQSQAARQTSFDSEPLRSRQLADDRNGVPGLDKPSTNVPAQTISTNETEQENPRKHLVLAGESFWSIAQSHYDDGRFFRALYEYNKQLVGSFENLVPGSTLATPPKTELARLWPELCPEVKDSELVSTNIEDRIYVTRQGDTLFEIARQRLEQASRYLEIQQLNQTRLPDGINHLTPLPAGIQLVLPLDISQ